MITGVASSYLPGIRSRDWIKIKKQLNLDLIVGGYIPGKGSREPFFGGLLLGACDSGKLIYTGRVGSGFSQKEIEEIYGDSSHAMNLRSSTLRPPEDAQLIS